MKKNIVILITILALGAGFGVGYFFRNYQVGKMRPNFGGQIQDRQRNGQGPQTGFGGMVAGEVISQDDKSITVKLVDGSSKIVLFSDKTQINKTSMGTKDDLKVGEKVAVFGTDNTDGSVTAQNIQLNPIERNIPTPNQ